MHPLNVVVLISGSGSNLQTLIDQQHALNFRISAVISNKAEAYGLERAKQADIPAYCISHLDYPDRLQFDNALREKIDQFQPGLVVLAGFMRILTAEFTQHFTGRMLNIHPSLLPKYKGQHTHQRVLEQGEQEHGCSIHFVTADLDGGPVIAHSALAVSCEDTPEILQARVQKLEHKLYPEVVSWFASGRLKMHTGSAWLDDQVLPEQGLRY